MSVLTAGTRIGPYEIVSRIGAGGMSEVYRAFDPRIRRDVAIKVLPPTLAKFNDRLHRFEQEARAVGALNHPNLLTIFDTGKSDGRPYIVTELLEGQTLRGMLRESGTAVRIPIRKAIDFGIQIANGLAAAHERGVVHRDLKPENLFITKDGRMKILDFGVAKLRSADDEAAMADEDTMEQDTSPGTVIGTVGYMSPEQVRGQAVDHRSDIFSLGTLLYEMVTGEHPFRGSSPADTMSSILREDPRDLVTVNPNVTPGLDRVIRHCMEKSPEQRFQSARDLAFHLDMLSSGSGTAPTIETKISDRWNRPLVSLLGAVALVIAGFGGGWLLRSSRMSGPRPLVRFTQVTHEEGLETQPAASPDGDTFVFTHGGGTSSDIYLQRVNGRNAINLTKRCAMADSQPAFSPDGMMIAYRSECDGGGIFIMGATGEAARRITTSCFNPSWSPDSKRLTCGTESVTFTPTSRGQLSELWVVDAQSGQRKLLLASDGVQPAWSPHGNRIAYWGMDGENAQRDIWTIDPNAADPSKTIARLTNDVAVDWNPVWSPDGQYLYFGSDRGGAMNLWRVRVDEESGEPRGDAEPVTVPARFSAHYSIGKLGTRMLYAAIDQKESLRIVGFDPVTGATVDHARPVMGGTFLVFSSAISPDGRFAAVTNRGGQEDLFVVEIATGEIRQLTDDVARDRGVFWSPDGTKIYFYSQRESRPYEIWSINADGSNLTRVAHVEDRGLWYPTISPDGKKLATYNDEHTYLLDLSVPDAKLEQLPATHQGSRPAFNAWSPDGTALAGELRGRPGIVVYTIADRNYRPVTTSGNRPLWLPGGKEILYGDNGKLHIVNIDTGDIRDVTTTLGITAYSLSADARMLIYSDRQAEADVWMSEVGGGG